MDSSHVENDLVNVLFTEAQIQERLAELAKDIEADYEGKDLLIVGILRGAVMVMADLARAQALLGRALGALQGGHPRPPTRTRAGEPSRWARSSAVTT